MILHMQQTSENSRYVHIGGLSPICSVTSITRRCYLGSAGRPNGPMPIPLDFRALSCLHMGRDQEAERLASHSRQGGTKP